MSLQCGGENISKCDGEFLETPDPIHENNMLNMGFSWRGCWPEVLNDNSDTELKGMKFID